MNAALPRSLTSLLERESPAPGAAAFAPTAASTVVEAPPAHRPSARPARADEIEISGGE